MKSSPLWRLRGWLRMDEAATYLSDALGNATAPADLLRLGLDGLLPLSLSLAPGTEVADYPAGHDGNLQPNGVSRIEGLWDLWLRDSDTRLQLEHDYQWATVRSLIPIGNIGGVCVYSGAYRFRARPTPGSSSGMSPRARSAFPEGSILAVRVAALDAFAKAHRPPASMAAQPSIDERPLGERERGTLLTIIAGLCDHADIDVAKPAAAAQAIAAMTEQIGASVSQRAIQDHLNKIPDVLERRGKN